MTYTSRLDTLDMASTLARADRDEPGVSLAHPTLADPRQGRVLVTGATGFAGSAMLRALVGGGYRVRALLLGSMAIERMIAAAVAIALAASGLLYLAAAVEPQMRRLFLEIIAAAAAVATLGVLAVWWTPLHRVAGRAVRERISPKVYQLLKKLSAALVSYRAQPAALAFNLVLAIAENLLQIVNFYVIGRGLGIRVPMLPFFAAIAVTALVRRLAMHVEGRGLGEGAAVVMFALLGVQKDAAVALTFAHYALWLLASLPGAYLLFRSGVRFRDLERAATG